jgi:predicted secreted protein
VYVNTKVSSCFCGFSSHAIVSFLSKNRFFNLKLSKIRYSFLSILALIVGSFKSNTIDSPKVISCWKAFSFSLLPNAIVIIFISFISPLIKAAPPLELTPTGIFNPIISYYSYVIGVGEPGTGITQIPPKFEACKDVAIALQASDNPSSADVLAENTDARDDEIVARFGGGVAPVQGGAVVHIEAADVAIIPQKAVIPVCIAVAPLSCVPIPTIAAFIAFVAAESVPGFAGIAPTTES